MKKYIFVLATAALTSSAFGQSQQPDPVFLQNALGAMQAQRNQAMDAAAIAEAKAAGVAADLAKAQARIKELEAKKEEKK